MPSFRAALEIAFLYPTGKMTYSSDSLWFGIEDWERLLISLESGDAHCEVSDLSYDVTLRFSGNTQRINVVIKLRRRIAGVGEGELNLHFGESYELRERALSFAKSIRHQYENLQ